MGFSFGNLYTQFVSAWNPLEYGLSFDNARATRTWSKSASDAHEDLQRWLYLFFYIVKCDGSQVVAVRYFPLKNVDLLK